MEQLAEAQRRGYLGPGPVRAHVAHAAAFLAAVEGAPARFVDLGSGGGAPGLVCAVRWADATGVLVEVQERRGRFLEEAVVALGLSARVRVVILPAEEAARRADLRGWADVVTARSFGPPAVTAECGAGFLAVGGVLLVSEPPRAPSGRWPEEGLAALGLRDEGVVVAGDARVRRLRAVEAAPARIPRRTGVPRRKPAF